MWGMTPIDQLWCRIQFRQAAYDGIYTPPTTDRHWIQYPGYNGGSDWGGIAIDPERGIIVANYNDMPNHNRLLTARGGRRASAFTRSMRRAVRATHWAAAQAGAPYAIEVNAGWRQEWTGPPLQGAALWRHPRHRARDRPDPLGQAVRHGAQERPVRHPEHAALRHRHAQQRRPLLTASGLVFIAAATDDLFRAIDIETGEVLWQAELPAGGQANPFAYEVGGKQYVGIMSGGHHFMETPIGDYVTVWALP